MLCSMSIGSRFLSLDIMEKASPKKDRRRTDLPRFMMMAGLLGECDGMPARYTGDSMGRPTGCRFPRHRFLTPRHDPPLTTIRATGAKEGEVSDNH